ncbi:MAG: right-handed parallel beta-helix repeat-containing protein [Proteobacteria bacterium]|nr:right-handed parallel beta-helix repeat-containing protein [Pseudomonadota bacterium]
MRILVVTFVLLASCATKPNPNRCCIDEADCASEGLPTGMVCDDGLVCRGNQCIAQLCASSAECDATAPYCIAELDGRCQEACTSDTQCPGFGQSDQPFCVDGACVACRTNDECTASDPICRSGTCSTCIDNAECASGVCKADGVCADTTEVAYVSTTGSTVSECTVTSPCSTLVRAFAVAASRRFVVVDSGTYSSSVALVPTGPKSVIGRGATRPALRRAPNGPIFELKGESTELSLDYLDIGEAVTAPSQIAGSGVRCSNPTTPVTIRGRNLVVHDNAYGGIETRKCALVLETSEIYGNGFGIVTTDSNASVDRSNVHDNGKGLGLDNGTFSVTNSFITHNTSHGIDLYSINADNHVDFNTIVDNNNGIVCSLSVAASFTNNIVARNAIQLGGSGCSLPGSVIDVGVATLHFKSPDVAPFDYHLTAGSLAIDIAALSTMDHDFDGEARPQGAGRDVGADELKP